MYWYINIFLILSININMVVKLTYPLNVFIYFSSFFSTFSPFNIKQIKGLMTYMKLLRPNHVYSLISFIYNLVFVFLDGILFIFTHNSLREKENNISKVKQQISEFHVLKSLLFAELRSYSQLFLICSTFCSVPELI